MDNNNSEESFEDMLEKSFSDFKALEPGQSIEAEIVSIYGDNIFLELGGKSEGIIDSEELKDKDGKLTVKEGDIIKAFFIASKNGEMQFTTKLNADKADKNQLESAFKNEIPVEGIVQKEIKGGFEIKIGESKAFCPYSQMGSKRVDNPESYIGKHLTFKIIEHNEKGRNILVSNRAIIEEQNQKNINQLKETLKVGAKVTGIVKSIQDFGAFVDVCGVQTLLPISEISRSRVDNISDILKIGDDVNAVILNLDWKNNRISISMKELISDPWDEVNVKYKIGQKYKGEVARITNFGAFITLEPGLDGLIHVSELQKDSRDSNQSDILKKGQSINVVINSIDVNQKRLSLKFASTTEEDEVYNKYMEPDDSDTYNPFAELLKKKK